MTEPEEKTSPEIAETEGEPKPEMDEIVTETYDKSLHLSPGAPPLDPLDLRQERRMTERAAHHRFLENMRVRKSPL